MKFSTAQAGCGIKVCSAASEVRAVSLEDRGKGNRSKKSLVGNIGFLLAMGRFICTGFCDWWTALTAGTEFSGCGVEGVSVLLKILNSQ